MFRKILIVIAIFGNFAASEAAAQAVPPQATVADEVPLATDSATGLTLEDAMAQAEAQSFAARIAQKAASEAEARAAQAAGALGPKLAVEANDILFSKKVNKLDGDVLPNGTPAPDRVETAAAVVTQPLVGLAPLLYKLSAESHLAEASRHDADLSARDARHAGADANVRALKAQRLFEVAKASQGATEKQLSDAKALENQGRISPVDVMRIELSLSDVQMQLIQARATVEVAALALIETLGLPAATPRIVLKVAPVATQAAAAPAPLPDLKALTGAADAARPDLKAAENRIEAARRLEAASLFDYLPTVNGFARFARDFTATDLQYPLESPHPGLRLQEADVRDQLSVGVTLNWTIWDWNQRLRRGDELQAGVDKAQLTHAALASRVHAEVAQAHAELRAMLAALAASRVSLRLAEEVYRATELKFQNGLATTTDLIGAERDQTRARGQLAIALGDLDFACLKLRKAAGEKVAL
jgi:outer membrane protein TolC